MGAGDYYLLCSPFSDIIFSRGHEQDDGFSSYDSNDLVFFLIGFW